MRHPVLVSALISFVVLIAAGNSHAESWRELLDRADSLAEAREYDSAIVLAEIALDQAETLYGPEDTAVARVLCALGLHYFKVVDNSRAEIALERALGIQEESLGPMHQDLAITLNRLAYVCRSQGRYADAEELFRRSLIILEEALGSDNVKVAMARGALATTYSDQGRYSCSVAWFVNHMEVRLCEPSQVKARNANEQVSREVDEEEQRSPARERSRAEGRRAGRQAIEEVLLRYGLMKVIGNVSHNLGVGTGHSKRSLHCWATYVTVGDWR